MSKSNENKASSKLGKLMLNNSKSVSSGGNEMQAPGSMLPPVLKQVGKLAAGVASLNPSGETTLASKSVGSATGNPRNKCALKPGCSLMDWIRLGNSGKDLTGVGDKAGKLVVTPQELLKHNTPDDAWMSIRGNVYNVSTYLPFHPGGMDQLMRGVGITDATPLFDEVHPWVNYEKMLSKCFIGRLSTSMDLTTGVQFTPVENAAPQLTKDRSVKFDWIQRQDILFFFFYTGAFMNPHFEVRRPLDDKLTIVISYKDTVFLFKIVPHSKLLFPPQVKINYETGKIEVGFQKERKEMWPSYGLAEQTRRKRIYDAQHIKKYVIEKKVLLTNEIFLLSMSRYDHTASNFPIGSHIFVYNDDNESREYTPVPYGLIEEQPPRLFKETYTSSKLTLLVKKYPEGKLGNMLFGKTPGDVVLGSEPHGDFDLRSAVDHDYHLCITGGVGVNPLLALVQFLLEKRVRPVAKILLVCYHQNLQMAFLQKELESVTQQDDRFAFCMVLTRAGSDWPGLTGRFSAGACSNFLAMYFDGIPEDSIYFHVCGSTDFNTTVYKVLMGQGIAAKMVNVFTSTILPPPMKEPVYTIELDRDNDTNR